MNIIYANEILYFNMPDYLNVSYVLIKLSLNVISLYKCLYYK